MGFAPPMLSPTSMASVMEHEEVEVPVPTPQSAAGIARIGALRSRPEVPIMPPPPRPPAVVAAPSSPTEVPVPTAAPSPTSPAPFEGDEDYVALEVPAAPLSVPPPVVRRDSQRRQAHFVPEAVEPLPPSSPTEMPVPTAIPSPTSPADDLGAPATMGAALPRRRALGAISPGDEADAPSSPTFLPELNDPTSPASELRAELQLPVTQRLARAQVQARVAEDDVATLPPDDVRSDDGSSAPFPREPREYPSPLPDTTAARRPRRRRSPAAGTPTSMAGFTTSAALTPTMLPTEGRLAQLEVSASFSQQGPSTPTELPSEPPASAPPGRRPRPPTPDYVEPSPASATATSLAMQPGTPTKRSAWGAPPTRTGTLTEDPDTPAGPTPSEGTRFAVMTPTQTLAPATPTYSPTEDVLAPGTPAEARPRKAARIRGRSASAVQDGSSPTYLTEDRDLAPLPPTPTYSGSSPTYVDDNEPPTPTLDADFEQYGYAEEDAQGYMSALHYTAGGQVALIRTTGTPTLHPGTPTGMSQGTPLTSIGTPTVGTPTLMPSTPLDASTGGTPQAQAASTPLGMRLPGLESPTPTYEPDDDTILGEHTSSVRSFLPAETERSGVPTSGVSFTRRQGVTTSEAVTTEPYRIAQAAAAAAAESGSEAGTPRLEPGTPDSDHQPTTPILAAQPVTPVEAGVSRGTGQRGSMPAATSGAAASGSAMPPLASEVFPGRRRRREGGAGSSDEELPPWKRRERRRNQ